MTQTIRTVVDTAAGLMEELPEASRRRVLAALIAMYGDAQMPPQKMAKTKTTQNVHARKLTAEDLRRIAVAADADPRSVTRVLNGQRVRGPAHKRIHAALESEGLQPKG